MDTGPLKQSIVDLLSTQADHPVWPKIEVTFDDDAGELVGIRVLLGGEAVKYIPAGELTELHGMYSSREKAIKLEADDPYDHGWEPPFWAELDWFVADLRASYPGQVVEICIFGGNRAGKTDWAAKRMIEVVDMNDAWLLWAFHTDQKSSRAVQQDRMWKYMPLHHKPAEGRTRKSLNARMNYNQQSGFTENGFALNNGSRCEFKFYSGEAKSLEGDQPGTVWSDEQIPLDWVKAIAVRLLTRAGQTKGHLCDQLKAALAKHEAGQLEKIPRILRSKMWQGVHVITFTPIDGMTPSVSRFTKGAKTVKAQQAKQLPIIDESGEVTGYEMMPRITRQIGKPQGAGYIFNEDNPYGGNHEGMCQMAKDDRWSEAEKKIKLYGYTEKTRSALFSKFNIDVHVKDPGALPIDGTWYHVVDPCNGRNWFMGWFLVDSAGTSWAAYEWPPVEEYVPALDGVPGPWVLDPVGKKFDGDKGPAQTAFGWGTKAYYDEILRIEGIIYRMQHSGASEEACAGKRIEPLVRMMDSRALVTPNASQSGTVTLLDLMSDMGMEFEPTGKSISAEGETATKISEGTALINDALDFSLKHATKNESGIVVPDPAQAPHLYVLSHCANFIWVFENYTGLDGQSGAGKDPCDVLRYFVISDPIYMPPSALKGYGGGTY